MRDLERRWAGFRRLATVMLLLLVLVTAGCREVATTEVDCQAQIRVDGTTFTSYSSAPREAKRHGTADQAECHDTGQDPAGAVFPNEPHQVETWRFDGYPPAEVLGVRGGHGDFEVYVADSLPDDERDRILEELGGPDS